MSVTKPIFWHQGMFLQPQHFQMADLHQQAQLQPYQNYIQPYFWGISNLSLQSSALEHRMCDVESGELMFPDGSFINLPGNAVIKSRSFSDEWVDQDKPFNIYLGVKRLSQFESNVTVVSDLQDLGNVNTRFVTLSNPEEVRDVYNQSSTTALVKSLSYVIKIVWETEKEEMTDYQLLPIAQVIRDGDAIKYSTVFCPPAINLAASQALLRRTKEIRDEIIGRFMQLDSYKLHASREYDPNIMRYNLAQQALSRFVPRLFHFTETGNVHPWSVYGALRELVAEISTFTDQVNVLGEAVDGERLLPMYDHLNLGECFGDAHSLITKLLNEITIGPKHLVDMVFDGECYTAGIPADFFKDDNDFYLVINTEHDFASYQHSLLTVAKLASRDTVSVLVERSLPGVGVMHVPFAPPGLPRRANTYYVKLDKNSDQWASLMRSHDVALLWEEAPDDAKIELVVLRR